MSITQGLFKSSIFSIIARFIGVALNFGVAILLSRLLNQTDYGTIFLLMTMINGIALISRIGIEQLLVKEIAGFSDTSHSHHSHFLMQCYKIVISISLLFIGIWLITSPIMKEHLFHNNIDLTKLMLSGVGLLFFNLVILNAFFHRGIHKTSSAVLLQNALPGIAFLILLLLFINTFFNQQFYIDLYTISLILAGITSIFIIYPDLNFKLKTNDTYQAPKLTEIIKQSLPLAPISLLAFMMLWADTIMVGLFLDMDQVALFGNAAKISFVCGFFLGALDAVIYPRLVRVSKQQPEQLKRFFWISTALVIGALLVITLFMGLFGSYALAAFGEEYVTAYPVLIILLVAQWFRSTNLTFSFMFIIEGQVRYLNMILVAALVINLLANALLIPRYGIEGAAIATCLANAVLAASTITLFFNNKLLTNKT